MLKPCNDLNKSANAGTTISLYTFKVSIRWYFETMYIFLAIQKYTFINLYTDNDKKHMKLYSYIDTYS